jgi:hypothetical protein
MTLPVFDTIKSVWRQIARHRGFYLERFFSDLLRQIATNMHKQRQQEIGLIIKQTQHHQRNQYAQKRLRIS